MFNYSSPNEDALDIEEHEDGGSVDFLTLKMTQKNKKMLKASIHVQTLTIRRPKN